MKKRFIILVFFFFLVGCASSQDKLFMAIERDDILQVKRIIDKEPDLAKYAKNKKNQKPLEYAAEQGRLDIAQFLRNNGASVTFSQSQLARSVKDGDINKIKMFIAYGADVNTRDGQIPILFLAAESGLLENVQFLVEQGADVNANFSEKSKGGTPLHAAVSIYSFEIVRFLIEKGADVNACWYHDRNINYKVSFSDLNLHVECKGITPLHMSIYWATKKGSNIIIELLIQKGADVNLQDANGCTPLYWAVRHGSEIGSTKVLSFLIKNGADVNIARIDGFTPLHEAVYWASKNGNKKIVKLLLKNGANPNLPDENGTTPIQYASYLGRGDIADILRNN